VIGIFDCCRSPNVHQNSNFLTPEETSEHQKANQVAGKGGPVKAKDEFDNLILIYGSRPLGAM